MCAAADIQGLFAIRVSLRPTTPPKKIIRETVLGAPKSKSVGHAHARSAFTHLLPVDLNGMHARSRRRRGRGSWKKRASLNIEAEQGGDVIAVTGRGVMEGDYCIVARRGATVRTWGTELTSGEHERFSVLRGRANAAASTFNFFPSSKAISGCSRAGAICRSASAARASRFGVAGGKTGTVYLTRAGSSRGTGALSTATLCRCPRHPGVLETNRVSGDVCWHSARCAGLVRFPITGGSLYFTPPLRSRPILGPRKPSSPNRSISRALPTGTMLRRDFMGASRIWLAFWRIASSTGLFLWGVQSPDRGAVPPSLEPENSRTSCRTFSRAPSLTPELKAGVIEKNLNGSLLEIGVIWFGRLIPGRHAAERSGSLARRNTRHFYVAKAGCRWGVGPWKKNGVRASRHTARKEGRGRAKA